MPFTLTLSRPLFPHPLSGRLDQMTPLHTHTSSPWSSFQDYKLPQNLCLQQPTHLHPRPDPGSPFPCRSLKPQGWPGVGGRVGSPSPYPGRREQREGRKALLTCQSSFNGRCSPISPNPPNPPHPGMLTPKPVLFPLPLGCPLRSTRLKQDGALWPGALS